MATDEIAVAVRAGGEAETAVDHSKDPLDPGDMDLSGEEHVPKVQPATAARSPFFHWFHEWGELRPRVLKVPRSHASFPSRRGSRTRSRSSGRSGRRTSTSASWKPCSFTAAHGAASKVRARVPVSPRSVLVLDKVGRAKRRNAHPSFRLRSCRAYRHQDRRANPEPRAEVLHQGRVNKPILSSMP